MPNECDLPISGGSVGPVLLLGALALAAGCGIVVGIRRSGRPVTSTMVIALLAASALVLAAAPGIASSGAPPSPDVDSEADCPDTTTVAETTVPVTIAALVETAAVSTSAVLAEAPTTIVGGGSDIDAVTTVAPASTTGVTTAGLLNKRDVVDVSSVNPRRPPPPPPTTDPPAPPQTPAPTTSTTTTTTTTTTSTTTTTTTTTLPTTTTVDSSTTTGPSTSTIEETTTTVIAAAPPNDPV